jgi:hypothetical protein
MGRCRLLLAACLAALALLAPAAAAEAPTRSQYVAELERICEPGSKATQRAVRGVRADVKAERFRLAGAKFAKARRIFAHTVRGISTVPRPPADAGTLARWFAYLNREKVYLGRIAAALATEKIPRFQRALTDFFHQGNRANNAVISFGFNYCSFKPSRFQ